jgi:leader peptidase (prepilin peptidase)/N-methyltransferase
VTGPEAFVIVASGTVGAIVGSFLNAVIYRLPRPGLSVLQPRRSICPACGASIAWHDNLPILSWAILRGKCRSCRGPISVRYPFVEALTAAFFAYLAYRIVVGPGRVDDGAAWMHLGASALFVSALLAATFIDIDHTIIPDRITKPGMIAAPFVSLLDPALHRTDWIPDMSRPVASFLLSVAGIAAGAGAIWGIGFLGALVFRKKAREHGGAMGFGDVKFMGLVGGFLGPVGVLLAILIGCVLGTVVGIPRLLFSKQHWIPFGPFLSAGAVSVLLYRPEIVRFLTEDYPRFMISLGG